MYWSCGLFHFCFLGGHTIWGKEENNEFKNRFKNYIDNKNKIINIIMSIKDKLTLTKSFNTLFMQFMDDVVIFLPNDNDYKKEVKQARSYFDLLKSMNPALIIKIWYTNIYIPYKQEMLSNDIVSFILKKNYENDLSVLGNAKDIIAIVNNLKVPINSMTDVQKDIMMQHLRKLSFLSTAYAEL